MGATLPCVWPARPPGSLVRGRPRRDIGRGGTAARAHDRVDDLTFGAAGAFISEMSTPLPPFEEVVTAHGPTVLRVCRAVLGSVDADDAWSETFLAALRAYPTLEPGSNVEAWLVTIAHRK